MIEPRLLALNDQRTELRPPPPSEAAAVAKKGSLMRRTLIGASLALVAFAAAACSPAGPAPTSGTAGPSVPPASTLSPGTTHTGGILRVGQAASDVGTVDPHYASSTQDRALDDMVFNGLLRFKPGDATSVEADLAT